jgi:hypothetical protein
LVVALASGSASYAFHLFGTWPLAIIATVTPVFGWIALVLAIQRQFGVRDIPPKTLDDVPLNGFAIARNQSDLAAQIDFKRRFGV